MVTIVEKQILNPTVTKLVVEHEKISKKAKAGQFIILRVDEAGERIPLTIADTDPVNKLVTIIFQVVGATTRKLNELNVGDVIYDFVTYGLYYAEVSSLSAHFLAFLVAQMIKNPPAMQETLV